MQGNTNRTCFCCGNKYNYCPTCYKYADKDPSVYIMFDSVKCKTIFKILNDVTWKYKTPLEAKETLNNIGVNIDTAFKYKNVKTHLLEILNIENDVDTQQILNVKSEVNNNNYSEEIND